MTGIYVVSQNKAGETLFRIHLDSLVRAEAAFEAISKDTRHQTSNWFLLVDGEEINWHCPLNK